MLQIDMNNFKPITNQLQSSVDKLVYRKKSNKSTGRWTKEEHQKFIEGIKLYGRNWKKVEENIGTRSGAQVRSHAQKFFLRLEKEFDVKFDDLDLIENRERFEEIIIKLPDHHLEGSNSGKITQGKLDSVSDASVTNDALSSKSLQKCALSQTDSPTVNPCENLRSVKRPPRKMSEDVFCSRSYSFFDMIMSKIKDSDSGIITPKLSDLIDLTSTRRTSFDEDYINEEAQKEMADHVEPVKSSFKVHPRKMSEDNALMNINKLRHPDFIGRSFVDYEILCKKLKTNHV